LRVNNQFTSIGHSVLHDCERGRGMISRHGSFDRASIFRDMIRRIIPIRSRSRAGRVLVHAHIYKNAGTSVDRLLEESFGRRWAALEQNGRGEWLRSNDLAVFIRDHLDIVAVSSHSTFLIWPNLIPEALPIVFLRHPIDRALSVYDFARRDPTQPDHIHARDGSFRDYVMWALRSQDGGAVVRNYQVTHLSEAPIRAGNVWHARPTPCDLRYARSLLESWPSVGLVRRFRESMAQFQNAYVPFLPALKLRDVRHNESVTRFATEQDAISYAHEALGTAVFDDLCAANDLDLDLYGFAARLCDTRIKASVAADTPSGLDSLPS
jgi:hypothetical protein